LTAQALRHGFQAVDKRIWWQEANSVRIPLAITLGILQWAYLGQHVPGIVAGVEQRSSLWIVSRQQPGVSTLQFRDI
jgi:hypothetical protein